MLEAVKTGLSALQAIQKQLDVTANNITNAETDGFKRTQVRMEESATSSVKVTLSEDKTPGPLLYDEGERTQREGSNVSLEREMVSLLVVKRSYEANRRTLTTAADMEKSLIDLFK